MNSSVSIDITPDKSLIQKLGLAGYRTEQAIAELLDNSIDARRGDGVQKIRVCLDFKEKRIKISDDGYGMDKADLTNAMTIARGTKADGKLGQFGIGMKSACSALGKKFIIVTSKIDSNKEYRAEYDERIWLGDESKNWKNFTITEKITNEKEDWHGTKIIISELNISLYPNQISKFKENFGIRYYPYLQANQVSIQINTVYCKPERPDIILGSETKIKMKLSSGRQINGNIAMLKKRSIKGHYGIHLFRNGRLIKAYEKFGFTAHPENAKIIGELNLDHVPVNYNKNEFIQRSEYHEVEDAFKSSQEFKHIYQLSRSKHETTPSIESIFGYFSEKSAPHHLDSRMRSNVSKELLNEAESFEMKIGDNSMKIRVGSLESGPLYTMEKKDSHTDIVINRDNESFKFVKNPLFLIGIIASEIKLLAEYPDFEKLLNKRNHDVKEFLLQWSKKPDQPKIRERKTEIPQIKHYNLADELIDPHDYLQDASSVRFQFTALSTLAPYLHNLRGKLVYTVHTTPTNSEYIVDLLSQKFQDTFAIVSKPDINTLNTLLKMPKIDRIIAVREYSVIKGSTIATPEKALVDLIAEIHIRGVPLDEMELQRIFQTMKRYDLVDIDELKRCANNVKKSTQIEKLLEVANNG